MTGYPLLDGILAALTALLGAYGVYAGGKKSLADARALKAPPPTPYEALADRLTALEVSDAKKDQELSRLRTEVRRLRRFITGEVRALVIWHERGHPPPPPEHELEHARAVIAELEKDPI